MPSHFEDNEQPSEPMTGTHMRRVPVKEVRSSREYTYLPDGGKARRVSRSRRGSRGVMQRKRAAMLARVGKVLIVLLLLAALIAVVLAIRTA